jgi:hypothetical protein
LRASKKAISWKLLLLAKLSASLAKSSWLTANS